MLQLKPGHLLKVSNASRPEICAHCARVWPSKDIENGRAALSPFLAYNLGIDIHVMAVFEGLPQRGDHARSTERSVLLSPSCQEGISTDPSSQKIRQNHTNSPEKDEDDDYFISPSQSGEVRVRVANEIQIAIVREPAYGVLQEVMESKVGSGDAAVQAIETFFQESVRIVCEGDVLAAKLPSTAESLLQGAALGNLDHAASSPNLLFFRVESLRPNKYIYQAIDPSKTVVRMVGTCSSGFPPTARGYLSKFPPVSTLLGLHPQASSRSSGWELLNTGLLLPTWQKIARLTASALLSATSLVPLRIAILLHGPVGAGKRTAITAAAAALGYHKLRLSCQEFNAEGTSEATIIEGLQLAFTSVLRYRPALFALEDIDKLIPSVIQHTPTTKSRIGTTLDDCIKRGFQDLDNKCLQQKFRAPVILIATAASIEDVPAALRRCFTHEIYVDAPDDASRQSLLRSFLSSSACCLTDKHWADLARHTAGLLPRDIRALAAIASSKSVSRAFGPKHILDAASDALLASPPKLVSSVSLDERHLKDALAIVQEQKLSDLGAPKIPNVEWDDIGGLEMVKTDILDTIELPLKHPELFAGGLRRRSGILLYGPPGTGKTLLAKAVATECKINFLSVKGPELINMYVGESERQVREVFAKARQARPCVIFFDELDSLAPARGHGSDSGGVMDRVVSQLLAEIDSAQGKSGTDNVFVIGATNRPDLLDPALLRPGRLDKLLYVGVSDSPQSQLKVIKALTRKFNLNTDVNLEAVVENTPALLTGADLYALCASTWMAALQRCIKDKKENVEVKQSDFHAAVMSLQPSLSEHEIRRYERLRDEYQGNA